MSTVARKNHSAVISGLIDILKNLEYTSPQSYGFRECQTSIVCRGLDDSSEKEYEVKAVAYGGASAVLKPDIIYYHKSRLMALNTDSVQSFFFDAEYVTPACDSEALKGSLANRTGITGLGIIMSTDDLVEPGFDTGSRVAIIQHTDYHPATKQLVTFTIEYRIRPHRHLERLRTLFKRGREAMVTGFIIGWDKEYYRWIVDVTGINLTSGSETLPGVDGQAEFKMEQSGRKRGNFEPKDTKPRAFEHHQIASGSVNSGLAALSAHGGPASESSPLGQMSPGDTWLGGEVEDDTTVKGKGKRAKKF